MPEQSLEMGRLTSRPAHTHNAVVSGYIPPSFMVRP
jgi:hypothetical protein